MKAHTWVIAGVLALIPNLGFAQVQGVKELLEDVGIDQKIGKQVPLDLPLMNSKGDEVTLGDLIGERPVVLSLVYYECPMLCTQVLNGLLRAFTVLELDIGEDFDIVTLSIDPKETAYLAHQKKREYISRLRKPEAAPGWHFLVGPQTSVAPIADAVGFRYAYDEKSGQWAHASGIMLLTPEGKVSRYMFGIEYSVKTLRLGLVEASKGKIGNVIDALMLLCFQYDPSIGKYSLAVMNTLRVLAVITMAVLGGFIIFWIRRDGAAAKPAEGAGHA